MTDFMKKDWKKNLRDIGEGIAMTFYSVGHAAMTVLGFFIIIMILQAQTGMNFPTEARLLLFWMILIGEWGYRMLLFHKATVVNKET